MTFDFRDGIWGGRKASSCFFCLVSCSKEEEHNLMKSDGATLFPTFDSSQ